MECHCCCSCSKSNGAFTFLVLALLAVTLISGLGSLLGGLGSMLAMPQRAWLPLSIVGVGGTVWGLWTGFRTHGRAEPMAVGVLGLAVAGAGFLFSYSLAVLGVALCLGAALWSMASAHDVEQRPVELDGRR